MSAFGIEPWGNTAPWGGPGQLSIIRVLCVGTNKAIIFWTAPPKAQDWGGWEDATNPTYWTITPVDPVQVGIGGVEVVPPGVRRPSFNVIIGDLLPDDDDPTQLVVRFAPQLEPGVDYDLELVGTVLGAGCEGFAGQRTFRFRSRNKPEPRRDPRVSAVDTYRDFANPYFITDPTTGEKLPGPGSWQVAEDSDIVLSDNAASLKKRVLRVIQTERGAFAHLPDFGQQGLIKTQMRQPEIQALASKLQEQINRFADVRSASVVASVDVAPSGGGILRVRVAVQPRTDGVVRLVFQKPLS